MNCELVKVRTEDHVHLHGLVYRASKQKLTSLDAAVICHGLGGNFYGSRLNHHLGEVLLDLGITVAHVNTRGHDEVNLTTRDGKSTNLGAAFEIVDECRYDLRAWIDFLNSDGHQHIACVGHSLGAIKSLYTQAHQPHAAVQTIVAVSASRLSYEKFLNLPTRQQFEECFGKAKDLVDQGRGADLIKVSFPFPTHITAQAYVNKYGPADHYNWLNFAHEVDVPTLLVFGEKELAHNSAFVDILSELEDLQLPNSPYSIRTIAGADHFYSGKFQQLGTEVRDWLCNSFAT